MTESLVSALMAVVLNRSMLLIGHSGNSKSTAINQLQESLMSLPVKEALGIPREQSFRLMILEANTGINDDEIERVIYKIERRRKKEPNHKICIVLDCFNQDSTTDPLHMLNLIEKRSKNHEVAIIVISSNDNAKIDPIQTPTLNIVRLPKVEKGEINLIARKIMKPSGRYQEVLVERVVDWYYGTIYGKLLQQKQHRLRDLYAALKQIEATIGHSSNSEEMTHAVSDAILRNFGFCDSVQIEVTIMAVLGKKVTADQTQNSRDLILRNLTQGDSGRHLMIVENQFNKALELIVDQCEKKEVIYEIIYEDDYQTPERIRELFKDLLLKIEHGVYFIIVGFEDLVPYFFSALEKQRENIYKKTFMQLPIGTHYSRFIVHQAFKCVFILSEDQYARLSPTISGVFEVHLFTSQHASKRQALIPQKVKDASLIVFKWLSSISLTPQEINQCFAMRANNEFIEDYINTLISPEFQTPQELAEACKSSLIRLATFSGIIKIDAMQKFQQAEELFNNYRSTQRHFSLKQFLNQMKVTWKVERNSTQSGFNCILHTLSKRMQVNACLETLGFTANQSIFQLSWFESDQQIKSTISNYFRDEKAEILIFHIEKLDSNSLKKLMILQNYVRISRQTYQPCVAKQEENQDSQLAKHLIVIVKIKKDTEKDVIIPPRRGWHHETVEMIEGDVIKNFGTEEILKQHPQQVLMTHTRFIAKQKIIAKHFDKEFKGVQYQREEPTDEQFSIQRVQVIDKILRKKENWELLATLMEASIATDTEQVKITESMGKQFVGTKLAGEDGNCAAKFTKKFLFDSDQWPNSLQYLLMQNVINPRQQLQMIVLQHLLKPTFDKHLPKVVLFLERNNMFSLQAEEDLEIFNKAKQLALRMFSRDSENVKKAVKGSVISNFGKFSFPYFEIINGVFQQILQEIDKPLSIEKIEKAYQNAITTQEIQQISDLQAIPKYINDFCEKVAIMKQQQSYSAMVLKKLLCHQVRDLKPESLCVVYYLYYRLQEFLDALIILLTEKLLFQRDKFFTHLSTKCEQIMNNSSDKYIEPQAFIDICLQSVCLVLYPSTDLWDEYQIWIQFVLEPLERIQEVSTRFAPTSYPQLLKQLFFFQQYFTSVMPFLAKKFSQEEQNNYFLALSTSLNQIFFTEIELSVNLILEQLQTQDLDKVLLAEMFSLYSLKVGSLKSLRYGISCFTSVYRNEQMDKQKKLEIYKQLHDREYLAMLSNIKELIVKDCPVKELIQQLRTGEELKDEGLRCLGDILQSFSFLPIYDRIFGDIIKTVQYAFTIQTDDIVKEDLNKARDIIKDSTVEKRISSNDVSLRLIIAIAFYRQQIMSGRQEQTDFEFIKHLETNEGMNKEIFQSCFQMVKETLHKNVTGVDQRQLADLDLNKLF